MVIYRTVPVVATIFVVCSCWKRNKIPVLQTYTPKDSEAFTKYQNFYIQHLIINKLGGFFFNILLVS